MTMMNCLAYLAIAVAQDEWPQYRGNAGLTGVSADSSVRPPFKLVWFFRADSDASGDAGAGVTVGGGKVYVTLANTRSLLTLDAASGRFLWEYTDPAFGSGTYKSVPAYDQGTVYLLKRYDAKSELVALRAEDGMTAWKIPLQGTGIVPARGGFPISEGRIFGVEGGTEPAVFAVEAKTGRQVWRTALGTDDGLQAITPSVAGGRVFVGVRGGVRAGQDLKGATVALEAATGTIVWRRRNVYPFSPLATDGRIVVCPMAYSPDEKVYLLDAATGETLWSAAKGSRHYFPATILEDRILLSSWGTRHTALDRKTGDEIWSYKGKENSGCSTPAISGPFAYFGTGHQPPTGDSEALNAWQNVDAPRERGIGWSIHAVDVKAGKSAWSFAAGNNICGDPAIAYGKLYFHSRDGRVYCFAPAAEGEATAPDARDKSAPVPPETVRGLLEPRADAERPSLKPPLTPAWRLDTGGRVVAAPAVAAGRVFAGSESGRIVAADAGTGKPLWTFEAGAPVRTALAAAGDAVYGGSDNGRLYALEAATGRPKWSYEAGGAVQASPAVAGGVVVFGANDHHLYALDRATGKKLWSFRTNYYSLKATPVVHGDRVYAAQWTDWVFALDLATGKELWRSYVPVSIEALEVHRDRVWVRNPYLVAELDPQNGKRLRTAAASYGTGGMAFLKNRLFLSGLRGQYGTAGATAVDLDDPGKPPAREIPTLEGVRTLTPTSLKGSLSLASMVTPLVLGDTVCFAVRTGKVVITEPNGEPLWSHTLGGTCHSPPVAGEGLLVVGCDDGFLYAFKEIGR